jgi:hypothetical protein
MSQIYAPGTILSFGYGPTLERVVVLSDNKVATKLYAGKPVEKREIMSLSDWQIIAASVGDRIVTDFIPVAVATPEPAPAPVATPEPVSAPVPAPAPTPESYPVGTKLSWKPNSDTGLWYHPNSRTAIVLKDGILQVKECIDGVPTMDQTGPRAGLVSRKFFSCLADWKATLPADGAITASVVTEDFSLPSIQRKAAKPVAAESDIDYIAELQKRYSVHAKLCEDFTPLEKKDRCIEHMTNTAEMIGVKMRSSSIRSASTTEFCSSMHHLATLGKRLAYQASRVLAIENTIRLSPQKANVRPMIFTNDYRQRIVAFVGGREVEITSSKELGLVGVAWDRERDLIGKWFNATTGKTFAELGIDLKAADGKPILKVYYRRSTIDI